MVDVMVFGVALVAIGFAVVRLLKRVRSDIWLGDLCYMRRWKFMPERWPGFRVHQILLPDTDRELHDHPFSFVSFVLWGGYWEERPSGLGYGTVRAWHGPGSLLFRRAEDLHRLDLKRPAWTFVLRGRYRREWGFLTRDRGWVPWHQFRSVADPAPGRAESSFR
jgi:hypothetical protein